MNSETTGYLGRLRQRLEEEFFTWRCVRFLHPEHGKIQKDFLRSRLSIEARRREWERFSSTDPVSQLLRGIIAAERIKAGAAVALDANGRAVNAIRRASA